MAGIAGIVVKKNDLMKKDVVGAFTSMMQKLSFSDLQARSVITKGNVLFGNVVPISCKVNNHYQTNSSLRIYAVSEGLIFVASQERSILAEEYHIPIDRPDCYFIPFLYDLYKESFVKHITGCFNIFIYDEGKQACLLVNDRLGFIPIYYYDSENYFIFASKIEAILNSGLLSSIQFDEVSIAEHLFFNYLLSDYTYIKNVFTLSNGEYINITEDRTARTKYWSISELFGYQPVDKQESLGLADLGLRKATNKIISRWEGGINLSLTGGWDSRVVLSYFLPKHKDMLHLYSFGAAGSDDVVIPQYIAQAEGLHYAPYILDQDYLDRQFPANALKTIVLSNGTRSYQRAHYLYAIQRIGGVSDLLVTGIFGDEVFKIAQVTSGEVLSQNTIDLLKADFEIDSVLRIFANQSYLNLLDVNKEKVIEGIAERLIDLKGKMQIFDSQSQKYYCFRFEYNLRKYFGNEANSYNDFVYCFSPFIDYDFLRNFALTKFFGIHYPFNSNSLFLKRQSTLIYHYIVKENYADLLVYNSARGYSMQDAKDWMGILKILGRVFLKRKKNIDAFNTTPTHRLFANFVSKQATRPTIFKKTQEDITPLEGNANLLSLFFWTSKIEKTYRS